MKHNILKTSFVFSFVFILLLSLAGTVGADGPEPNDPMPEEPSVEPEPPIDWAASMRTTSVVTSGVVPNSVEATLRPGGFIFVQKTVTLPLTPPKLDFVLIVDLSGSYNNDLPNIKSKAYNIFTGVRASVSDSQFGLATFVDFPFLNWGYPPSGDYAYRLDQDLTTDLTTWMAAHSGMGIRNGADTPESQYEALYQAASGAGRTVDGYTIPAGQDPSWRDGVTRVIAITTDAPFHNAGDGGGPFPYPGASRDDTVTALLDAGIKVIAIKAPGSTLQMDDVASATGGAVTYTSSTSAEIVEAILSALEELTFTVTPVPVGCDPLQVGYYPASYTDVVGGESVIFSENITVPSNATGDITCQVEFRADDTVIGVQDITIHVNQPPVADPNGPYVFPLNAGPFDGTGSYDPDGDPLTYDWDWGDGSTSEDAGPTPTHTYTEAGIYDVCLTVNDGESYSGVCTIAVIYDPNGGFVTGGGWIDSPAGAITPIPTMVWNQDFAVDDTGWFDNNDEWYGSTVVANGIATFYGDSNSAPFSRFDGYRSIWPGTWVAEIDIYLDPSWPADQGFDYSVASSGTDGLHRRDYIFHVGTVENYGPITGKELLVAVDNNAYWETNPYVLTTRPGGYYSVPAAGWYTLQHVFYNTGVYLAVDFNVLDSNGNIVWSDTRSDMSDTIPGVVGGNRYSWFTHIDVADGIQVDNHQLFIPVSPTGKATFGFVSKYKKGASVPTGNTEFQFKAGDLNFHSTSYDWLVVTGSNYAKFKGEGTINGQGNYKFQIWAGDGTGVNGEDQFRIKIWDAVTGDVIYDNGMDQNIGGGSIVVHTK